MPYAWMMGPDKLRAMRLDFSQDYSGYPLFETDRFRRRGRALVGRHLRGRLMWVRKHSRVEDDRENRRRYAPSDAFLRRKPRRKRRG